jgi:hypothetical protein
MTDTETHTNYTQRLVALADLIDYNPDLPLPYTTAFETHTDASWYLQIHGLDLDAQKATAAKIVSAIGGKWDKEQDGDDFSFKRDYNGLRLIVAVARAAVCERVVVGTHEVTVDAQPATKATKATTMVVEDVEWVCGSLLADSVSA